MRWLVVASLACSQSYAAPITAAPPPPVIVDTQCFSCGSGNGPSASELAGFVKLAAGEHVSALDGNPAGPTAYDAFAAPHDDYFHGEFLDVKITGGSYDRRVILLLH